MSTAKHAKSGHSSSAAKAAAKGSSKHPPSPSSPSSSKSSDSPDSDAPSRLPNTVIPTHYFLHLTPNLSTFKFQASVSISLTLTQPTSTILLNSAELHLHSASIHQFQSSALKTADHINQSCTIKVDEEGELATLTFEKALEAGEATLSIEYEGLHNDKMRGCYRYHYHTSSGKSAIGICTQFQSTDARRAFPCFDEPALKATFELSLTIDQHLQAISNMPVMEMKSDGDMVTHHFEKTPKMSSYLFAWVVGEFDCLDERTGDGTVIRCYTPKGKKSQGEFALDCALRILPFYNQFFNHRYPLPKLDMVAIDDFESGAMENWGCCFYRAASLLYDEHNSSADTKQLIALSVTHEISHQWFGNLVTMEWWDGLWLNEGFATFMENFATDYLFPDWKMWEQFVESAVGEALDLDSLSTSHPIEAHVEHAQDADDIFDSISYSKGSVVVRLLEDFLTPPVFQKGIQAYIQKFEYGNATTEDLWTELGKASGKPVKDMMEGWTKQVGYPLLTVNLTPQGLYEITQRRFLDSGVKEDDESIWLIPLRYSQGGQVKDGGVLRDRKGELKVEGSGWMKLNAGQTGMFRVHYPSSMLSEFRVEIERGGMTAVDRLGLESDLFALSEAGIVRMRDVLDFIQHYENEESYVVWTDLISHINHVGDLLKTRQNVYEMFSQFVRKLMKKIIRKMGWEAKDTDDHCTALLRTVILEAAVEYGDEQTTAEAHQKFSAHKSGKLLPADVRPAVYSSVAEYGGKQAYDALLSLHDSSDLQEEKERCIHALADVSEVELIGRSLDLAFSSAVKSQDAPSFLLSLASNPRATSMVWEYVKKNWKMIVKKFGGTMGMDDIVRIVGHLSEKEQVKDVEEFFQKNKAPGAKNALRQSMERMRSNAAYLEREGDGIEEWLKANVGK